jgi:hypothetical protein
MKSRSIVVSGAALAPAFEFEEDRLIFHKIVSNSLDEFYLDYIRFLYWDSSLSHPLQKDFPVFADFEQALIRPKLRATVDGVIPKRKFGATLTCLLEQKSVSVKLVRSRTFEIRGAGLKTPTHIAYGTLELSRDSTKIS